MIGVGIVGAAGKMGKALHAAALDGPGTYLWVAPCRPENMTECGKAEKSTIRLSPRIDVVDALAATDAELGVPSELTTSPELDPRHRCRLLPRHDKARPAFRRAT